MKTLNALAAAIVSLLLVGSGASAQTTYTWNLAGGGSWTTAGNWTPSRTTPAANDYLVINNGGSKTITDVPTQTIGKLTVSGGTTVALSGGGGTETLTIENNTGTELEVATGSSLTINSILESVALGEKAVADIGGTFTNNSVFDVSAPDAAIAIGGTFTNTGSVSGATAAFFVVTAGGTYQHARDGGTIPTATWAAGSTCNVTGITTTLPNGVTQTFSNFSYNCASQSAELDLGNDLSAINGNFTLASTGTGQLRTSHSLNATLTIGGSYLQTGGTFRMVTGDGSDSWDVAGNFTVSGGTLEMHSTIGAAGIATVNIAGNFSHTGGTIAKLGAGAGTANIIFDNAGTQTFTSGGTVSGPVNFTVNSGSTLQMAAAGSVVTGTGTFTLSSGASLGITSPDGISSSGATGNVQVTGTRSFNTGANYIYNGSAAQAVGSGLPATVNNLTINNAAGVTLGASKTVSNILTTTSGNITTGANTLTLGTSSSSVGSLSHTSGTIVGTFRRWINAATGARLFPIGTASNHRPATVDFTGAPGSGGTLTAEFVAGFPGGTGLPLGDSLATCSVAQSLDVIGQDGYWSIVAGNGLSGGTYTLTLVADGFPNIADESTLRIVKRAPAGSWTIDGICGTNSGTPATPTVVRTGMSGFSQFGIASSSLSNPLPVQLASFTGAVIENNRVRLDWRTISEVNNYGFYVQKKAAASWDELGFVPGHGTTNEPQNYTYTDYAGITGSTQYRLKQVDFDGTTFFTEPILVDLPTSVPEVAPKQFALMQNYPNPFNPTTEIKFSVENTGHATLAVYNSLGQQVATLFDAVAEAGRYNVVQFNAAGLSSGVYFYRLQSGQKSELKKLMLLK